MIIDRLPISVLFRLAALVCTALQAIYFAAFFDPPSVSENVAPEHFPTHYRQAKVTANSRIRPCVLRKQSQAMQSVTTIQLEIQLSHK
nr:hypothetical protein [uncultured Rhodoferax sp.]